MSFRFPIAVPDVAGLQGLLDAKLVKASNLADLTDTAAARANLGIDYSFNPTSLVGLDLWLDATMEVGLSNGANVASLTDFSGASRNATQVTVAKQPTFVTGALNSRPVFRFDGIDDILATPAFQSFPAKRGTMFIVYKATHATSNRLPCGTHDGAGTNWILASTVSVNTWKWYDGVADRMAANADTTNAWQLQTLRRNGDTALEFRRNGALESTLTVANNQPDSKALSVGKTTSGSAYFAGDIALLILYGRALDAAELAQVESWINRRYSLYV